MLEIQTIETFDALEALAPEWEALFARVSLRTPSKSPLWQLTWWRHFGARRSLACRHDMQVVALREPGGALVAVAPMMRTCRPGLGPALVREMQFFGADPYVTQLRGPVCERERLPDVGRALATYLRARGNHDFVQWRGLAPGACAMEQGVSHSALEDVDSILVMRESWDAFHGALPKKTRKHLRKGRNDLSAAGIAMEFRVATAPEEVAEGLAAFYDLHGRRAALADVTQHPNVFGGAAERAFLDDYCAQLARAGGLRLFQIRVGGRIVAARVGFAFGDQLYLYFSGYDPDYGPYSIMTTLMAEALQWAHENGVALVNLSSGVDRSKTRFRPEMVPAEGFFSVGSNWRARLAFAAMRKLRGGAAPAREDEPEENEAGELAGA
ncbi:GNAT family N-acetyltransferase [Rhodoblastus sp.]|uniref:GNAT family N-acetyltransferase n=1 Tax=Rhodoblastus sp. TaxID=1962975 RepID=UPI0035B3E32F